MPHPRIKFAFYSTIIWDNIKPILVEMFGYDEKKLMNNHMAAIFDQECTDENSEITGKPFGRIRNLDKVWKHERCQEIYECDDSLPEEFSFGPKNTLIIECDEPVVYNCHENTLIMNKFEPEDICPGTRD